MERLQKVLAQAGIASRRAAEQIILAGRVRVDGRIVRELGTQVDPRKSRVEVDGNKIVAEKLVYIVLHKPRGVVCTLSDPEGRPTILELIKEAGGRLVPVGRLDFHTSGALLCTNDGEFAQGLAHPKREVPKVYVAKVKGTVDDEALEKFSERIVIDGRPTQPAQVKRLRFEGDKTWLEITLREGRNRQVRRLGEATGFPVMRLARLSHAGVSSEDLRPGQWRELTADELVDLKKTYGVPKKVRPPSLDYTKGQAPRGEGPAAKYDKRAQRKIVNPGPRAPARDDSRIPGRKAPSGRFPQDASREKPFRGERAPAFGGKGQRQGRFQDSAREKPQRGERPLARPPGRSDSRASGRQEPVRAERGQSFARKAPSGDGAPSYGRKSSSGDRAHTQPVARGDSRLSTRQEPVRGERGQTFGRKAPSGDRAQARPGARGVSRVSNRKEPVQSERAQARPPGRGESRVSGRQELVRGARAQSARYEDPTRPWKTRSRSGNEERPKNNRRGRAPAAPQDTNVAGQTKRSRYVK